MSKKVKLFRITGDMANLERILERFVSFECIKPVESKTFTTSVHGLKSITTENPFESVKVELEEIEKDANQKISANNFHSIDYSYDNICNYIHTTHDKLRELNQHKKETEGLKRKYIDALTFVRNIMKLDIAIDDIFSCEYVEARFGKLPIDSVPILKLYETKPFVFEGFKEEKNYYWCMYMAVSHNVAEIDNIFSSMFFERIYIPDFVKGKPEETEKNLLMEIDVLDQNLKEVQEEIREVIKKNQTGLADIKGEIDFLNDIYAAKKYVVALGDKFTITGFLANKIVDEFIETLKEIEGTIVDIMPPNLDKRLKAPKRFRHCKKHKHK